MCLCNGCKHHHLKTLPNIDQKSPRNSHGTSSVVTSSVGRQTTSDSWYDEGGLLHGNRTFDKNSNNYEAHMLTRDRKCLDLDSAVLVGTTSRCSAEGYESESLIALDTPMLRRSCTTICSSSTTDRNQFRRYSTLTVCTENDNFEKSPSPISLSHVSWNDSASSSLPHIKNSTTNDNRVSFSSKKLPTNPSIESNLKEIESQKLNKKSKTSLNLNPRPPLPRKGGIDNRLASRRKGVNIGAQKQVKNKQKTVVNDYNDNVPEDYPLDDEKVSRIVQWMSDCRKAMEEPESTTIVVKYVNGDSLDDTNQNEPYSEHLPNIG